MSLPKHNMVAIAERVVNHYHQLTLSLLVLSLFQYCKRFQVRNPF